MAQSFFQAPSGPHRPAPVKGYTIRGTGKGNWQYVGGKGAKAPKLPAPKLNAAAKAAKANVAGQYGSALYDPSQQLTGKNLANAASSIADAQTKGPLAELASQIAANNKQSAGVQQQDFGYYKSLAQAAQNAVAQQNQVSAGLNTQLQGIGSQAQQQLAAQGQQALGGVNARMQALGLGGDTTANINAQTAQQQQTGAQNAQTFQAAGANQGAANESQALSQLGNTGLQGQEKIAAVAQANAKNNLPLTAKIADEQASKGALTATALGQLRTAERNYQISQEGLGVKQQALATTAAQNAAKNKLTAQGQLVTARGQTLDAQSKAAQLSEKAANDRANALLRQSQLYATETHNASTLAEKTQNDQATQAYHAAALAVKSAAAGKPKALTTSQQNTLYADISRVQALIDNGRQAGQTAAQIKQHLESGANPSKHAYDPTIVEAAYELKGWKYILPKTAAQLRAMGLRGSRYRVSAAPQAPKPGGILGAIGSKA